MRRLMLVAVAAMGVAGLFAPWGAERAGACTIGPPVLQAVGAAAHIVVVGTLSRTDEPVALLEVDRAYKRSAPSRVLRVDGREIGIGAFCEKEYLTEPGYHDGRVVAFLERTDPGAEADYEVISFGMAVFYVEGGMVGYWWEQDGAGRVTTTLEEMEDRLRETVGGPWPLLTATPAPTATQTSTPAATATSRADTPAPPASGEAGSDGQDGVGWAVVWVAVGVILGAAGVGGVWWWRGRRPGNA